MLKNRSISVLICLIIFSLMFTSCADEKEISDVPENIGGLVFTERVPLTYACCFTIDRYDGGYFLISTSDGSKYLFIPENGTPPENISGDIKVISRPVDNIYLAATSAMGLFDSLDSCAAVKYSGTKAEDWYIDGAKKAMENGDMIYAGKYNVPDYELLVSGNCRFSVQSTMINHSPETKEKLEELGITVFTDMSSYEEHPLGRTEWIKVYGEIVGKPELADELFEKQVEILNGISANETTGKTVVYFYINTSGQPVTRRSGDYVIKMIELAGGVNIFSDSDTSGSSSSVTMEMEEFYAAARDADIIIYNSAIDGGIETIEQLTEKSELLENFKAVKEGNVWCAPQNLFQETMKLGTVISDMNSIFSGNTDNFPPELLYRLERTGEEE